MTLVRRPAASYPYCVAWLSVSADAGHAMERIVLVRRRVAVGIDDRRAIAGGVVLRLRRVAQRIGCGGEAIERIVGVDGAMIEGIDGGGAIPLPSYS